MHHQLSPLLDEIMCLNPKIWRRKWQPTPVFLPGKVHGQRSLADYSAWGHMTACVHEGGGRWVGSNKLVELKKKKQNPKYKQY